MLLKELTSLQIHTIPAGQTFYRVQRRRSATSTVKAGPLRLAPPGLLMGRFDLADNVAAYMAESPEAALYEALFRRETVMVSMSSMGKRELVAIQFTKDTSLGDLRHSAGSLPVLQSLRFSQTQELAKSVHDESLSGVIFKSAQQFDKDCIALVGDACLDLKLVWRSPLIGPSATLNRWVAVAANGSRIPIVP
jgi:hypothetical protein